MKIKLNKEQVFYLNGLDNTETKKQFLLNCFIEQCEASLEKEKESELNSERRNFTIGEIVDTVTKLSVEKLNGREKFDKFIEDNGLKKFTPAKTKIDYGSFENDRNIKHTLHNLKQLTEPSSIKKVNTHGVDNYLIKPFIDFYNPFVYREEDTDKFLKDVDEASKFFNIELLEELKNYQPPHPDDIKKYSKKDLKLAFELSRNKSHFEVYDFNTFEEYEEYFKTLQ